MFHLMTHAFFKAVLFLGAGSVIIALHHEQDMRKMGGLRKFMPITYWTVLIGALANAGIPPFSGSSRRTRSSRRCTVSTTPGHEIAYWLAMAGVFVSALYSFRLVFFASMGLPREPRRTTRAREAREGHAARSRITRRCTATA
jgi:NADH-quinone oxidoreductase subunit L